MFKLDFGQFFTLPKCTLPDVLHCVANADFEEVCTPTKRRRANPGQSIGQNNLSQSVWRQK
jgi:hypothetical protein